MIRYSITHEELKRRVNDLSPSWIKRANERKAKFDQARKYDEASSIWGEIKEVFSLLQHRKCAYCERLLPGIEVGSVEHNLEHYRPKSRVRPWPAAEDELTYDFPTGQPNKRGYYWLAYDLQNYAVACPSCNIGLKLDRFPIAGQRGSTGSVSDLDNLENPLLIFPIGEDATDPTTLIKFHGVVPSPVDQDPTSYAYRRAQVTIDFFRLASIEDREELYRERSQAISHLWAQLEIINGNADQERKDFAREVIAELFSERSHHAACIAAFNRLWENNPMEAFRVAKEAQRYVRENNRQ